MIRILLIIFVALLTTFSKADSTSAQTQTFSHESDIDWSMNEFPIHRWKTLLGNQVDPTDILFGRWELAPNAIYHGHKHQAPEIYYIISGKALWTVGSETQEVTAGTAIYTKPGAVHKMVNLTDESLQAIWIWWAPNGDREVFDEKYKFTEEAPKQPENAGFNE